MDPFHVSDPFHAAAPDTFHASPEQYHVMSSDAFHGSDPFHNSFQPRMTRAQQVQQQSPQPHFPTPPVLQGMPKIMLAKHLRYPRPDVQMLYEHLIRIMLDDRRPVTVLDLKRKLPKKKTNKNTVKQLNYLLYDNEKKGFVQSLPPIPGARKQKPRWVLVGSNHHTQYHTQERQSQDYYAPDFNRSLNVRPNPVSNLDMEGGDPFMRAFNSGRPYDGGMAHNRQTNMHNNPNMNFHYPPRPTNVPNVPNCTNLASNHPLTIAINANHPLMRSSLERKVRWTLRQLTRLRIGPATPLHIRHCLTVSFNLPRKPKIGDINRILQELVEYGHARQVQDPERRCWRYVIIGNTFR